MELYFWTDARAAQQMDETDHEPGIPSARNFQVLGPAVYGQHEEKAQPMLLCTLDTVFYTMVGLVLLISSSSAPIINAQDQI